MARRASSGLQFGPTRAAAWPLARRTPGHAYLPRSDPEGSDLPRPPISTNSDHVVPVSGHLSNLEYSSPSGLSPPPISNTVIDRPSPTGRRPRGYSRRASYGGPENARRAKTAPALRHDAGSDVMRWFAMIRYRTTANHHVGSFFFVVDWSVFPPIYGLPRCLERAINYTTPSPTTEVR